MSESLPPPFQLFHTIADAGSGKVRRFVVERELKAAVDFRNVSYPEAEADWLSHGGTTTPAVWDGEKLFEGAEACIARLQAYLDIGRAG